MTDETAQSTTLFEKLGRDVKYAVRTLRREPTFVAGVVLTFALAIGANAAMFCLVTRLMLSPPPGIRDAAAVAKVGLSFISEDGDSFTSTSTSYPTFRSLHAQHSAFAAVAATRSDTVPVADPWFAGEPINYYYFGHFVTARLANIRVRSADRM